MTRFNQKQPKAKKMQIKLTRNVYEGVLAEHGIFPRILHEWISVECDDPEAVAAYLLLEWRVGYPKVGGVEGAVFLPIEDRDKFIIGLWVFADWDHKTVMNNVHTQMSYELMTPVEQADAEIEELEAWCEKMDL